MHAGKRITAIMVALGIATGALAQEPARDFTATAIQVLPDQSETTGKIAKSGTDMRLEFERDGLRTIRILRPTEGIMWILDPQNRTYMEFKGPPVPRDAIEGHSTPCPTPSPATQGLRCDRSGPDLVISGIQTERWNIAAPGQPPQVVYWDSQRRQALREEYPDGSLKQMTFKAMETLAGREVEHWRMELQRKGQAPLFGDWWFDTGLRVVLREELPDGSARRLEDIVVGPVDPALFTLPEGWTKQDLPAPAPPQN